MDKKVNMPGSSKDETAETHQSEQQGQEEKKQFNAQLNAVIQKLENQGGSEQEVLDEIVKLKKMIEEAEAKSEVNKKCITLSRLILKTVIQLINNLEDAGIESVPGNSEAYTLLAKYLEDLKKICIPKTS